MALNTKYIRELFPKVTFAFYGNHINWYNQKMIRNVFYIYHLIFKTFYRKDGIKFKGIFDSIIGVTLLIRDYITETEMDKSAIRSMPKDWISYAESEEFTIKVNNFLVWIV